MRNKNNNKIGGYTIIETMISVSLFLIIVTLALGSLLNANLLHRKSQSIRSIMDNLSFVMEDMSRNLRTGFNYYCVVGGVPPSGPQSPTSCPSGNGGGISFEFPLGGQGVYYINGAGKILKSVDGGSTYVQLTPDEVFIDPASFFKVVGAEPPTAGNSEQPFITIKLVGNINTLNGGTSPFSLQTSVSQRKLDW